MLKKKKKMKTWMKMMIDSTKFNQIYSMKVYS